jgi:hypothetical protein
VNHRLRFFVMPGRGSGHDEKKTTSAARMARSEIPDGVTFVPDFASLHPGYGLRAPRAERGRREQRLLRRWAAKSR